MLSVFFSGLGVDKDIVKTDLIEFIEEVLLFIIDILLEDARTIGKIKW